MTELPTDREITPEDVQTPAQLRAFMTLLDKQVRDALYTPPDEEPKYTPEATVAITASIRARGIHWALTRACEMLEKQDARIAALERRPTPLDNILVGGTDLGGHS